MKILVVEDDRQTRAYISKGLRQKGHSVDVTSNGPEGLELAQTRSYDAAVVDRLLPGLDGLNLVRQLRRAGSTIRVLILTSLGGIGDRVEGLQAGGDDYLIKPFAFSELLARVNAIARRPPIKPETTTLSIADLELDLVKRTVQRGGEDIEVHRREFALLAYMVKNAGRVVTRTMLLENVWQIHFDPRTKVVETHISRLRAKIDRRFERKLIRTIHGLGYRIEDSR